MAWATLTRLFSSEDPHLEAEALKFWGKYRLEVLLKPPPEEKSAEQKTPQLSPELAARLAALDAH
jgi:hypothetical protein